MTGCVGIHFNLVSCIYKGTLKEQAENKRESLWWQVHRKHFHAVYDHLDEALQKEIKDCPQGYSEWELMQDVLHREGMTAELATLHKEMSLSDFEFLSDVAILEIDEQLSNGKLLKMSIDAVNALIKSYRDEERNATIETLKTS